MHCARGGHDRVEMHLVETMSQSGAKVLLCPKCGHQEKQLGNLASAPELELVSSDTRVKPGTTSRKPDQSPLRESFREHLNEILEIFKDWWRERVSVKRLATGIREWWNGGEPIWVVLEGLSEFDEESSSSYAPSLPNLKRNPVTIDREKNQLRVGDGEAIPLSEAEVVVSRSPIKPLPLLERPIGRKKDKWIFEVCIRYQSGNTIVAEFGSLKGAERGAKNLREDICVSE